MPTEKGGGAGGGERRGGSGGARKSRDGPGNVGRRGGGGKQQPGDGDGAKGNDPEHLPLPDNHVPATNSTGPPASSSSRDDDKRGRRAPRGGRKPAASAPAMSAEEKAAAEAEKVRLAEEKEAKRLAEEERRKAEEEEERATKRMEAQLMAMQQIEDLRKAEEARRAMRASNSPASVAASREAHESRSATLKSDLKRITALKGKMRSLMEEGKEAVLKDIASLNLHMFVEELVTAIAESKLKPGDILAAIQVCSALHSRYAAFTDGLIPALSAILLPNTPGASPPAPPSEEDKETSRRKRQALRLLMELFFFGVHQDPSLLMRVLRLAAPPALVLPQGGPEGVGPNSASGLRFRRGPNDATPEIDVNLLVTLVRYGGDDLLGVLSRKHRMLYEGAGVDPETRLRSDLVPEQLRRNMHALVDGAFDLLSKQLEAMHKQLRDTEKRAEKDRLMYGTLTEDKEKALEDLKKAYDKLLTAMQTLSDGLDRDLPLLPDADAGHEAAKASVTMWNGEMGAGGAALGPFDDEETRAFYEELPDLLAMLPPTLLGLTEEEAERLRQEHHGRKNQAPEEEALGGDDLMELSNSQEGEDGTQDGAEGTQEGEEEDDMDVDDEEDDRERGDRISDPSNTEPETPAHAQLTMLLHESLPLCYNRDRSDDFCLRFCHHNSKGARKRLAAALIDVPRQSLDLLPQYARIAATLDVVMKELVPAVVSALMDDFRYFMRKKPTSHLEAKIKTVKYIGELVKFKVCPPIEPFKMLKMCLDSFTPHNVEVACALLECCGRFLHQTPHTHDRLQHFLEVMDRLCKVRRVDPTTTALIENAILICKPREASVRKIKPLSPLQQYIRHLLLERLSEDSVEAVIRQLRKLPWHQTDVEDYVITCAMQAAQGHFDSVHLVADVLAGLAKWHDALVVKLVDRLLEVVRRSMENLKHRDPQSHLALVKLLGEMYNYELISTTVVFNSLHFFLEHGHAVPDMYKQPRPQDKGQPPLPPLFPPYVTHDPRLDCPFDPPGDTYRTQLVCKLLQATGSYFVSGKAKSKLDGFLTYFQRYLFMRGYVPPSTEYEVLDLLDELEGAVKAVLDKKTQAPQPPKPPKKGQPQPLVEAQGPLLPRFNSFEEAHAAVDAIEREAYGNRGTEAEEEEEEEEDEDEEEEEVEGGEGTSVSEREEGEEEDSSSESDGEGAGEEEEEEDVAIRRKAPEKSEEDLEFEREFEKAFAATVMKSVDERKTTARVAVADNMLLPTTLPKVQGRLGSDDAENEEGEGAVEAKSLAGTPGIKFCMLKRGTKGRLEARELVVPAYTSLAAQIRSHRDAEREEAHVLKQRVLQYETARLDKDDSDDEDGGLQPLPPKIYNAQLTDEDLAPFMPSSGPGRGRGGYGRFYRGGGTGGRGGGGRGRR